MSNDKEKSRSISSGSDVSQGQVDWKTNMNGQRVVALYIVQGTQ